MVAGDHVAVYRTAHRSATEGFKQRLFRRGMIPVIMHSSTGVDLGAGSIPLFREERDQDGAPCFVTTSHGS
jgi:hypothetical protein